MHIPDYGLLIMSTDWDNYQAPLIVNANGLRLETHISIESGLDASAIKYLLTNASFVTSGPEYERSGMHLEEDMPACLLQDANLIPRPQHIVLHCGISLLNSLNPITLAMKIPTYSESCQANFSSMQEQAIAPSERNGWPGTADNFPAIYQEFPVNNRRLLQGIRFDTRSGAQMIKFFDGTVKQGRFLQIVFANAHTLNLARANKNYHALLHHVLVLNDGIGVNIASKLKYGRQFCENLNGTDLIPRYLAESRIKLRVFLLGASPDVAEACFEQCQLLFPQHEWLGFNSGYISSAQHHSICERIRDARPDVLLVAMGNPLQEFWIRQYGASTGAKLCIGVGALFGFLSGKVNRAPSWVRYLHCEWVYRLALEPRRMWRRYLIGNVMFLLAAWRDRHEMR
jgi:alpha-1,3-mannosyltransferase